MILAIDMGNSNIVVGGLDDNKTYFEERITTDDRKTSLEYAILLKNILEIHKVKKNDIEGSIMASVVPPLNAPISSAVKKITGKKPLLVGSGMKTGLNIKMDNPKTVGGDRIVAAVAANAKYKGPIIIADMVFFRMIQDCSGAFCITCRCFYLYQCAFTFITDHKIHLKSTVFMEIVSFLPILLKISAIRFSKTAPL